MQAVHIHIDSLKHSLIDVPKCFLDRVSCSYLTNLHNIGSTSCHTKSNGTDLSQWQLF